MIVSYNIYGMHHWKNSVVLHIYIDRKKSAGCYYGDKLSHACVLPGIRTI